MGLSDLPSYSRGVRQRVSARALAGTVECRYCHVCLAYSPASGLQQLAWARRQAPVALFGQTLVKRGQTPPQIARAAKAQNWTGRYNIHVGGYDDIEGEYG